MKRQKRHLNRVWFRNVKNVAKLNVIKVDKTWVVTYDGLQHPTRKFRLQRDAVAWVLAAFGVKPKRKAA